MMSSQFQQQVLHEETNQLHQLDSKLSEDSTTKLHQGKLGNLFIFHIKGGGAESICVKQTLID